MGLVSLPPDTRAVGTPDPAGDMNKLIDAVIAMGAAYTVTPSGDTTGVTDKANIQSLLNASPPIALLSPASSTPTAT